MSRTGIGIARWLQLRQKNKNSLFGSSYSFTQLLNYSLPYVLTPCVSVGLLIGEMSVCTSGLVQSGQITVDGDGNCNLPAHYKLLTKRLLDAWKMNGSHTDKEALLRQSSTELGRGLSCVTYMRQCRISQPTFNIAFCGFGCKLLRDAVLHTLRFFLKPKLMYASMHSETRWEGLLIVSLPEEVDMKVPETGASVQMPIVDYLQLVCENFRASVAFIELDAYLDAQMMACLARVESGNCLWGNWFAKRNAAIRADYALRSEILRQQEARGAAEDVETRLGLSFTPSNMLYLHQTLSDETIFWRQTNNRNVRESRAHLDFVYQRLYSLERQLNDHMHQVITDGTLTVLPPATIVLLQDTQTELRMVQMSRRSFFSSSGEPPSPADASAVADDMIDGPLDLREVGVPVVPNAQAARVQDAFGFRLPPGPPPEQPHAVFRSYSEMLNDDDMIEDHVIAFN